MYLDTAVIVEPRNDDILIKVLNNVLTNVHTFTKIQIFHGTENENMIRQNMKPYIDSGKIIINNLNVKNLTKQDYNKLLTSVDFWNKVHGENILIFQTDSAINSNRRYDIHKFLEYDYVGAPWKNDKYTNGIGGNGGFSFRKKSKMIEHIKSTPWTGGPEDIYFSKSEILKFPTKDIAMEFSVETIYYDRPYGFHKPWIHNINILECNEIKDIFNKS